MYLNIETSYGDLIASGSALAKGEKNDCVVRSIAAATNVDYNAAHAFCKKEFKRVDRRGVRGSTIEAKFQKASEKDGIEIKGRTFDVRVLGKREIKNMYKLKGEEIWRQKTLKSFCESHPVGRFVVTVSKHALTIVDGELNDWDSLKFKPTRKVLEAYELVRTGLGKQLTIEF